MPRSTVKPIIAPPKPIASIDMDLKKKEHTNKAVIDPTTEGNNARRPMSGRGKAKSSNRAMPNVVKIIAIRVSRLAVVSLSNAARYAPTEVSVYLSLAKD